MSWFLIAVLPVGVTLVYMLTLCYIVW